jgi:hypothetical protein
MTPYQLLFEYYPALRGLADASQRILNQFVSGVNDFSATALQSTSVFFRNLCC